MLATNSAYQTKQNALAKQPVFVAEIFFANGSNGVDGQNDVYFATCDVNDITGFAHTDRWFPVLKSNSISSMSQSVDPINGVSSIGNLSITVTDYNGIVSEIIKAADASGHGFRRQRINICMLYKGMDWADKIIIRTMQVNDLKLSSNGEYTITAADIQRQLARTVFNPYTTTSTVAVPASGGMTLTAVDARNFTATAQQTYGTCGFIQIDQEIIRWSSKTDGSFTFGPSDRAQFGTASAAHDTGTKISEIIALRENPVTMALKIMQSTGAGTNGTWDVYPARWGCGMDATDVNIAEWLEVGKLLVGLEDAPTSADGTQFEFVIDKGVEAKKFIEDQILKILGAYGFVHGDGRYGVRAYSDLSNAAKENASVIADENSVVKWGDLTYNYNDLTNQVWIEYDEAEKLSGKFIRNAIFIDTVSVKKWGEAKQLKYSAAGIIPTSTFASQLYQRFQRILARYSRPPLQIDLTMMPKYHTLEIGDIVRITLPIRDLLTGANLDRAFEVLSTQLKADTGEVVIRCLAQPETATFWFGGVGDVASVTISPASSSIVTGTTQQLTARSFDGTGVQVPIPAISWAATGNVTVDSNGLVTAGAVGSGTVTAIVGSKQSNVATIAITATANTNNVASVSISPSVVTLQAGQTQQLTAQAKDIANTQVNGVTFNWASSNAAVATVPAGPSVSAVVTAVANGTANITATETVSAISSQSAVTVAIPDTPIYTPPALADSAYQVGTKITAHGPVGGPHVIPNGYNFAAGTYWYDGDVSLATGTNCTVNGTVRIFSMGTVTINGLVDGVGRGVAGKPAALAYVVGSSDGTIQGFTGYGGNGAGLSYMTAYGAHPYHMPPRIGAAPIYQQSPIITPVATSISGGSWVGISGLPTLLTGSQSASGRTLQYTGAVHYGGAGGASGAGLMIIARGIFIINGLINLSGVQGGSPSVSSLAYEDLFLGAGGGGGGGSFVGLCERNIYGLSNMSVDLAKINTSGGAAGIGSIQANFNTTAAITIQPTAGTAGSVTTKVIG